MLTKKLTEKETRKLLSRAYDRLYAEADALFKEYNPCQIRRTPEGNSCLGGSHKPSASFCCNGCRYLRKNGCGVKSLSCKLWLCHALSVNNGVPQEFKEKLQDIRKRAYGLLYYPRMSKKASLNRALDIYFSEMKKWNNLLKEGSV